MTSTTFSELGLSPDLLDSISEMGFKTPSPIQQQAIPLLLQGKDIVGQAQTGTGKTAAFGIPLIQQLEPDVKEIQALIVCPTRELAVQVSEELAQIAKKNRYVRLLAVYGGEAIQNQLKALKRGVNVVVGTPGRMMDHMRRGTINFEHVKMVVLDEADEMLNMGFREDMEYILDTIPKGQRQTVLFSATMPAPILEIAKKFQRDPKFIKISTGELTSDNVEQFYYDIKGQDRFQALIQTLQARDHQLSIVFCNTKLRVDELASKLNEKGIKADALHGDLNQRQRNQVLNAFKSGSTKLLVATDVAARGIDVNNVDAVYNFDIPLDPEYYVHRIGRTGRAGNKGQSFSFVCGSNDFRRLKQIQAYSKVKIEKIPPPTQADIFRMRRSSLLEELKSRVEDGKIDIHFELMDDYLNKGISQRQLTAALLSMVIDQPSKDSEEIEEFNSEKKIEREGGRSGGGRSGGGRSRGGRSGGSRSTESRGEGRYGGRKGKPAGKPKFFSGKKRKRT